MENITDLTTLNPEELAHWLESFDEILCDQDGVLFSLLGVPLEGIKETIKTLQQHGKRVRVVTNNCTANFDTWQQKIIKFFEYEPCRKDFINPTVAMIHYLKKINFDKELYVIGTKNMKEEFKDAGFKLADTGPVSIEENIKTLFEHLSTFSKEVGAVIFDIDMNLNYIRLAKAYVMLQNPDVHFITGAEERMFHFGQPHALLGPGYFQDMLVRLCARKPYSLGKPSIHLGTYILETLNIKDPSKVLFVGDMLVSDMSFASKCGFKKLLVFTGDARLESLKTAKGDELPDFYVNSFGDIHELMKHKSDH